MSHFRCYSTVFLSFIDERGDFVIMFDSLDTLHHFFLFYLIRLQAQTNYSAKSMHIHISDLMLMPKEKSVIVFAYSWNIVWNNCLKKCEGITKNDVNMIQSITYIITICANSSCFYGCYGIEML